MRSLATSSAKIAAAACALCAWTALGIFITGLAAAARRELAFGFPRPTRQLGDAVELAAQNGRYAAAVLIACLAVTRAPLTRPYLDAGLAALLALNALVIGVAAGAYGFRLVRALAPHGTLELAAFSLAGGAYLHARRDTLRRDQLAAAAVGALALVALAALAETWLAPGATP